MYESPVKQNLCFYYSCQRAPDDGQLIIYSVLRVLARGRDLSRSANAVSAGNHKFSPLPSHLAPSFEVTSFESMEKLYGFWN